MHYYYQKSEAQTHQVIYPRSLLGSGQDLYYDVDLCGYKTHALNPYTYICYPFSEVICAKAKSQKSSYNKMS